MTIWKKTVISAITGVVVSGMGFLLVTLGGWGPCGPASTVAYIGGLLCFNPYISLCTWFPAIENLRVSFDSVVFNIAILILIPATCWSLLTFAILSLWQNVSTMGNKAEPDAALNDGSETSLEGF